MKKINAVIVGMQYHSGATDKLAATPPGTEVILIRDPGNKYDANAIRCEIDGQMCGHIPKDHAQHLAYDMDNGAKVTAEIVDNSQKYPLLEIKVETKE